MANLNSNIGKALHEKKVRKSIGSKVKATANERIKKSGKTAKK